MENYKITVSAKANEHTNEIQINTDIFGNVSREILDLKDQVVTSALIDLGWTPPKQ